MTGVELDTIDCHVHVQSARKAEDLLRAMDQAGVATAILMGSSRFTITLRPADGFTCYHENNLELLKAKKAHPDRFVVWPTLDPTSEDNCRRLEGYVTNGASGLKLYVGHAFTFGEPPRYLFHTTPIDSDLLQGVYELCSNAGLPICLHVNTTSDAPGFREEFERVLESHLKLRVLAPHWMLASRRLSYLRSMLKRFANVWTDISFGQDKFLEAGLRRISKNSQTFSQLIRDFPDRFLCGSDIVCTTARHKTIEWMAARMLAYRNMLATPEYECPVTGELRNGLSLPEAVLPNVLRTNARYLLSGTLSKSGAA